MMGGLGCMPVVSCDQKSGMLPRICTNDEKLRKLLFPALTGTVAWGGGVNTFSRLLL